MYKIRIKDTLLKESINNVVLKIKDLVVSRKFSKGKEKIREKLLEDLKDLFKKFEEQAFLLFRYNTRIKKLDLENQIFLKEKLLGNWIKVLISLSNISIFMYLIIKIY